ncbi:MarR family transcriptional regulator [soil metagenome]
MTHPAPTRRAGDQRPSPAALHAWRTFLRAHALIVHQLEAELVAEEDLPLASYDVLLQLAEAPDRRLRMTELAGAVLLSRSGLTRLVDRLTRDGLVRRENCVDDGRGTYAVLTDAGLARLCKAAKVHLPGVRAHMTGHLRPEELETLAGLLDRLVTEQLAGL